MPVEIPLSKAVIFFDLMSWYQTAEHIR